MLHPALREKGRAIPQSHGTPKLAVEKDKSGRVSEIHGKEYLVYKSTVDKYIARKRKYNQ